MRDPLARAQPEDLEGLRQWIDEPRPCHAFPGVDGHLLDAIDPLGRRRENLAHPVRGELECRGMGHLRHAFAAPPGDVGHEYVAVQVELGLMEEDPAPGAALAPIERAAKLHAEARGSARVGRSRAWLGHELTVDDLGDEMLGDRQQILVSCSPLGRTRHIESLPDELPRGHVTEGLEVAFAAMSELEARNVGDGVVFRVRVKPRARRSAVLGVRDGMLDVAVAALPAEGAANAEVVLTLAVFLGIPKSRVEIESGASGRIKRVRVEGLSADAVHAKVQALTAG